MGRLLIFGGIVAVLLYVVTGGVSPDADMEMLCDRN